MPERCSFEQSKHPFPWPITHQQQPPTPNLQPPKMPLQSCTCTIAMRRTVSAYLCRSSATPSLPSAPSLLPSSTRIPSSSSALAACCACASAFARWSAWSREVRSWCQLLALLE